MGFYNRKPIDTIFSYVKPYASSFFFAAAFLVAGFAFAGRLLPNEPIKRLPFAVFLSPLPII